jgi:tetratricopeptide (TPR) repeat protein
MVLSVLLAALLTLQQPETMSLLQKPLFAPQLSSEERGKRNEALAAARASFDRDRTNVDAILAIARAEMALGRVGDALEVLTRGLETRPDDPRLTLERGRGLIVIRKFELAAKELRKAVETLPDAHCALGLAEYLSADYAHARESFGTCPDPGIFAYLADRRAGHSTVPRPAVSREPTPDPAAPIRMPGAATKPGPALRIPISASYMDAAERLIEGKRDAAKDGLKKIVEKDAKEWMDPVYIAAEADYARILKAEGKKGKKQKAKGRV